MYTISLENPPEHLQEVSQSRITYISSNRGTTFYVILKNHAFNRLLYLSLAVGGLCQQRTGWRPAGYHLPTIRACQNREPFTFL